METPELFEQRRAAWLEVAAGWRTFTQLTDELSHKLDSHLRRLVNFGEPEETQGLSYLFQIVIQAHHQAGAPLVLPLSYAEALFRRPGDFLDGYSPLPHVGHVLCVGCCFPMVVRTFEGSPARIEPLLPSCPVCDTAFNATRSYRTERGHYPNSRKELLPRLELHLQKIPILSGTWPHRYGVEIPEAGDLFVRKELS